ncbi:uncharacterized protein LOC119098507 [Pollicipes pollicipes]|uniref:uncharacterized protein LOC119098507 n=1 Tax=Pollicipes pollicipes TaxID=41117 RepID=UPI0018857F54|nr:uncharacterized protein LOC119098507 [Pollicipes pollicipes]
MEEDVGDADEYVSHGRPPDRNENDHCLVACQLRLAGRRGVLLLDSGCHVPRVVVVMADGLAPHTGPFVMDSLSGHLTYEYQLSRNNKFVINTARKTSPTGITSIKRSCIFVAGRFENPYAFAEYRNIFHTLRSLIRRAEDGRLLSGLYFPLRQPEDAAITVFWHTASGQRQKMRLPLAVLAAGRLSEPQQQALQETGRQLMVPLPQWERLLQEVVDVLSDRVFIQNVVDVNEEILLLSSDN